jgi:hypothetical protein
VFVRLDDAAETPLTNLQVEVLIHPDDASGGGAP